MRLNPYVFVTIVMALVYVYSAFQCSKLLSKIQAKGQPASWPWSNRKKYNAIKNLYKETKDPELNSYTKKYLFYANLGEYTIYIGITILLLLMMAGVTN